MCVFNDKVTLKLKRLFVCQTAWCQKYVRLKMGIETACHKLVKAKKKKECSYISVIWPFVA